MADDGWEKPEILEISEDLEKQQQAKWRESEVNSTNGIRARPTAYLDGLRGLGAFMVYMSHNVPWFYGFDNSETSLERGYGDGSHAFAMLPFVRILFTGGSAAVAIFFVLSGYVLSIGPLRLLHQGQARKCRGNLVSASIRRPIRLFLPSAGVSLIFALVMQLPQRLRPHMTWPEPKENIPLQLQNWAEEFWMVINPLDPHGIAERWFPYDPPLWTIAIEFRGSFIVFALIAVCSYVGPRVRLLVFSLVGLRFLHTYEWSIFCFMAGMVIAANDLEGHDKLLFRRMSARVQNIIHVAVFILGWWLICQPAGKNDPERAMKAPGWYHMTQFVPNVYYVKEYWRFWHAWGATLTVYGVLRVGFVQNFFNTKYMQWLGKVSFALYLTHIPFLWTLGDRIYRIFGTKTFDFTTAVDDWCYIPDLGPRGLSTRFLIAQYFIMPMNLLIAYAATIWLDQPSIRLGRWFARKITPRSWNESRTTPSLKRKPSI